MVIRKNNGTAARPGLRSKQSATVFFKTVDKYCRCSHQLYISKYCTPIVFFYSIKICYLLLLKLWYKRKLRSYTRQVALQNVKPELLPFVELN